jgi:hypothetical protein
MEWRYSTAICGNPLNRIDPTGLYQEDMHYYIERQANSNREKFLGGLVGQEEKYPGVCLPRSIICKPV